MIPRLLLTDVLRSLAEVPAVCLLGPRQVGKTTLALEASRKLDAIYLDLESEQDRAKLAEPEFYLEQYLDRLVILDEVHRAPGLFPVLRGLIDRSRRRGAANGRYLLLGSASLDLLRQSGESLAGRIRYLELTPFSVLEPTKAPPDKLWLRGGFPDSLLAKTDASSLRWRQDFIRTYLERDMPQFGPRIAAETLRRFWTMLAHRQGSLLNAADIAGSQPLSASSAASLPDFLLTPQSRSVSSLTTKTEQTDTNRHPAARRRGSVDKSPREQASERKETDMRRTAVKSANDQPEGRSGEAGDRRNKLTRLMRLVALPLLLSSAAVLNCFTTTNDGFTPWGTVPKFDLQYDLQDEGNKLHIIWTYGANNDYIKSNQMLSREKAGVMTYTLDKKALACNAVNPSTNFVVRIGYDDTKRDGGRGSVGTLESNPLEIPSVVTPTLKLYGNSDQTRANGLTFNTSDWSASGITFAERQGAGAWFVVVDSGGKLYLTSAHLVASPEWGVRENQVAVAAVDFDDLSTCPPTADPDWTWKSELEVGKTYGLWQGQFGGWNITDRFAKAKVMAIDSNEVTLKLAVQPKSGLRWITTE